MATNGDTSTSNYTKRDGSAEPTNHNEDHPQTAQPAVDQEALQAGDAFYNMFKSACHGITRRQELEQLYNATYLSFGSKHEERPEFSKVLFAMAREMKVLRVIRGGTLSWKALSQRDDRRDDRQDDRRPRYDDRREQAPRDDRRPPYGGSGATQNAHSVERV